MEYYTINKGSENEYRAQINEQHATDPIEVAEPVDTFVLPVSVLDIEGILEVLPTIESLPIIDGSEIVWLWEEEPMQLPA